jgi:hypothetical protein
MDKHSISREEAFDLFEKLISERTRALVLFASTAKAQIIFWGFVRSFSSQDILVIQTWPPSDKTGTLEVPLKGRKCKYGYVEAWELPNISAEHIAKAGDTKLIVKFPDSVETLCLSFTFR